VPADPKRLWRTIDKITGANASAAWREIRSNYTRLVNNGEFGAYRGAALQRVGEALTKTGVFPETVTRFIDASRILMNKEYFASTVDSYINNIDSMLPIGSFGDVSLNNLILDYMKSQKISSLITDATHDWNSATTIMANVDPELSILFSVSDRVIEERFDSIYIPNYDDYTNKYTTISEMFDNLTGAVKDVVAPLTSVAAGSEIPGVLVNMTFELSNIAESVKTYKNHGFNSNEEADLLVQQAQVLLNLAGALPSYIGAASSLVSSYGELVNTIVQYQTYLNNKTALLGAGVPEIFLQYYATEFNSNIMTSIADIFAKTWGCFSGAQVGSAVMEGIEQTLLIIPKIDTLKASMEASLKAKEEYYKDFLDAQGKEYDQISLAVNVELLAMDYAMGN
jgi:hypothetical protein